MKDAVKNTCSKVKNHIKAHKGTYALGTLTILLAYGSVKTQKQIDVFLTERGINPLEFWAPQDYQELINK